MAQHVIPGAVITDPTPRIEGHLSSEIALPVAPGRVTDVKMKAEMFRGYENIMKNRAPQDAILIMNRI